MVWLVSMISAGPLTRAGGELRAAHDAGVVPGAAGKHRPGLVRGDVARVQRLFGFAGAAAARVRGLDGDRLDDDRLVVVDEAELRPVGGLEGFAGGCEGMGGEIDRQRGVGAVVAEMAADIDGDVVGSDCLACQLVAHGVGIQ